MKVIENFPAVRLWHPAWHKILDWLIKLIILIALIYLLKSHYNEENDIISLWQSLKSTIDLSKLYLIFFAILFIPVNWNIESYKWKILTEPFESISYRKSIYSILCGITLAIITPNRIGEYGGRIIFLHPKNKAKGLVANMVASISQNSINICLGFFSAILFYDLLYAPSPWVRSIMFFLWSLMTILMAVIYFNIDILRKIFSFLARYPMANRIYQNIEVVKSYTRTTLTKVLSFSFLRFSIYVTQYILILYFFGITPPIWILIIGVATIFFIQTGIPLPPLLGILARGEIAILIWGFYCENELSILAATYSLWILNLVIPAFIGLLVLLNTNLLKSFGYGDQRYSAT